MHRTRTCTTHTITHLRRQVHTHLYSHDGTTGTVRCAQVHRYSGEPTPSKLTCTHTQARAGPHRCVCVHTHRSTQTHRYPKAYTITQRTTHAGMHTPAHSHGAPTWEGISCPLHREDRTPFSCKEIPVVPPLRLQINRANPRAPQSSAILWWQPGTWPSFLWGQFFLEPLPR